MRRSRTPRTGKTVNVSSVSYVQPALNRYTASPLLDTAKPDSDETLRTLFSSPTLRPQVLLVAFTLIIQQFAGINAVLFYSTPVLRGLLPQNSGLIGIFISLVNVGMTVPSLLLIDVSPPPPSVEPQRSAHPSAENREETTPLALTHRDGRLRHPPRPRTGRTPPAPRECQHRHLRRLFRARARTRSVLAG